MPDKINEMFPDWKEIKLGEWSQNAKQIEYQPGRWLEIGLYREPDDGTYTLQIFDVDDIIFCQTVDYIEED